MVRILLTFGAALAACTPSPQENAMRNPSSVEGRNVQGTSVTSVTGQASGTANSNKRGARDQVRAALGPSPEPVSAAANPAPAGRKDSPVEAQGRRTLSTAFVRIGPDGLVTVELSDGLMLVLREVIMRPRDYCGVQVLGGAAGPRYCGGYAEVAAARPGGAPALGDPDLAVPNPIRSPRRPTKQN